MRIAPRLIALAAVVCTGASALGHVFWIAPTTFTPLVGQTIGVQLRVGDVFPGDALPRDDQRIVRFVVKGPTDQTPKDVIGRDGRAPAGLFRATEQGVHVMAYQSGPSPVMLEAPKFETYLKEKGLEKIVARRAERHDADAPVRELFARCAKSVMAVETHAGNAWSERIGLRLELLPLSDPTVLRAGDELKVAVVFDGRPLVGALLEARSPESPSDRISVRTDQQGEASVRVPAAGTWVLDTVEMIEAEDGTQADWQSYWGSLTFRTTDAPHELNEVKKAPKQAAGKGPVL